MTTIDAPLEDPSPRYLIESEERHVILVRHASTEWSKSGQHTGRTDIPLDDDGRRMARLLRDQLGGINASLVLSSPLARARDTCELAGFSSQATLDEDLLEWDYGDYEGKTTAEIREDHPGWTVFVDGCPNGEDASDVGRRADRVIKRLRDAPDDTAIIFSHGHYLRVFAARWLGLDAIEGRHFLLEAGAVSSLGYERDVPAITSWNWKGSGGVAYM